MNRAFRILFRLLFVAALATAAVGSVVSTAHASTNWYVSPSGNDSNSCLSLSEACATIQAAIEKAATDDEITVAAGTYHEHLIIHRNVTITGAGMTATIVNADGVEKGLWIDNTLTVTLNDIGFTNSGSGYSIEVANAGIIVDVAATLNLNRARIYKNLGWGIIVAGTLNADHSLIDQNVQDGVYVIQSSNANLTNVTLADNQGSGLRVHASAASGKVMNSIVTGNDGYGILTASGAPNVPVTYSDFWQNGSGDTSGSVSLGTGVILLDPQFVNPGSDYRLTPQSPAIDAGNPAGAQNDPDGSRNDMGAFPFDGPKKPGSLTAKAFSPTQINLTWNDNAADEDEYRVERSQAGGGWSEIAQLGPNAASYSSTGLTCDTPYSFRVRAYRASDGQFSAYSNVATAATQSCLPPPAPTNLSAQAVSPAQINLSWTDNSADESDFRIERSTGDTGQWSQVGSVTANTTTFSNTGLACNKSYTYRVRAHRSGDDSFSEYSEIASAATLACAPEMDVRSGDGSVSIASGDVTPNTGDGTDFGETHVDNTKVTHRFTIANTGSSNLQLTGSPIIMVGGAAASDFKVTKQPPAKIGVNQSVSFEITFNPTLGGTRVATISIDNNDSDENPYTFSVQGQGNDTYYAITVNRTGDGIGDVISVPSGINCGPTCSYSFGEGTTIKLIASPEIGSQFAGWSGGGCSGMNDCDLMVNAAQTVTAAFETGSDQTPEQVLLTSPANNAFINTPTFDFGWESDANAAKYRIHVSRNRSFSNLVVNEVVNGTSFSGGTLPDGKYFWRVRGINAYNEVGPWSSEYSFILDRVAPGVSRLYRPKDGWYMPPTNQMFVWSKGRGVLEYTLQVAEDAGFTNVVLEETTTKNIYRLPNDRALNYGEYYWRVSSVDANGNASGWSMPARFAVTLLRSPQMDAFTRNKSARLSWITAKRFDQLQLEIATDAGFNDVIVHKDLSGKSTSYAARGLSYQKYYWRIQYREGGQWSGWLPGGSFTVTPGVFRPVLWMPKNEADADLNTPTLTWRVVPPVKLAQANTYEVQIDTTAGFKSPDQIITVADPSCVAGTLEPGKYFWRVRAINGLGYAGPWSPPRFFKVR